MSGSIGTGTKRFEKAEAERLAAELNVEYPEIDHEAVVHTPPAAEPAGAEPVPPQALEPCNAAPLPEGAS